MIRHIAAAVFAGFLALGAPVQAQEAPERLSSRELAHFLSFSQKPKPGANRAGNDTCRYAQDMECDEPGIGTGLCAAGSDYSDC